MSNVFFISDLHFGHKKILEFSGDYRDGRDVPEHDEILIQKWNETVRNKRDLVFVLGDIAMSRRAYFQCIPKLNGRKILSRGNHDHLSSQEYLEHFEDIRGIFTYKNFWVTHGPVHPIELRGRKNIHGHVHTSTIMDHYHQPDERYINVCVEACGGYPVNFEEIRSGEYKQKC